MRLFPPKRSGRFLHVMLGMVIGVALMAVVAAIVASATFRQAREREMALRESRERMIADLQKQSDELQRRVALDRELNEARRDAERIRAGIESRNKRISELQRGASPGNAVAGRVTRIDGEFATVNIGSDQGVESDQVMYVYRSILLQEYVGTLKLLRVNAEQSVGLFTPSGPGMQIQLGDIAGARNRPK